MSPFLHFYKTYERKNIMDFHQSQEKIDSTQKPSVSRRFFRDPPRGEEPKSVSNAQESMSANDSMKSENRTEPFRPRKKIQREVFEWLEIISTSVVAVVIVFTFFFRIVAIEGPSMMGTLMHGERVVISNFFYEPARGDIVVISRNINNSAQVGTYEEPIIKRVIATEGEVVDIDFKAGVVMVDGVPLEEPYILEPTYRSFDVNFPVRVKENCVFVLGDNRNDSLDSRSTSIGDNGMVDEKYILGKAVCRVFPLNKFGSLK